MHNRQSLLAHRGNVMFYLPTYSACKKVHWVGHIGEYHQLNAPVEPINANWMEAANSLEQVRTAPSKALET